VKRGLLNYSVSWNEDGRKHEECYFSKLSAIRAYINMIYRDRDDRIEGKKSGISSLSVVEIYNTGHAENITGKINRFLY
jgi:hypothetical protein